MKRNGISAILAAILVVLFCPGISNADQLSEDLAGYYKFGFFDGETYAARAEMAADDTVKVYVPPDAQTPYLGIIVDDRIYFQDKEQTGWAVLTQVDEDTLLVTTHSADTGETREFSAVRITEEEADQIVEQARVGALDQSCLNNLKQIGLALALFAQDHEGELPYSLSELFPNYVSNRNVFVCPARGGEFTDFEWDYEYIPGFRIDSPNPGDEAVVIEVLGNHVTPLHHTLYLDGHVEKRVD